MTQETALTLVREPVANRGNVVEKEWGAVADAVTTDAATDLVGRKKRTTLTCCAILEIREAR